MQSELLIAKRFCFQCFVSLPGNFQSGIHARHQHGKGHFGRSKNSLDLLTSCYLSNCQKVLLPLQTGGRAPDVHRTPFLHSTGHSQGPKAISHGNLARWQKLKRECLGSIQNLSSSVRSSIK